MGAVVMLARSTLRRRWRSVVVLTLLVAFSGGVVLALAAGARRTSTSLARFEAWSRAADLEVTVGDATPAQLAEFRSSPGVRAVAELHQMAMYLGEGSFVPLAAQVDDTFGTEVDRARVVRGRAADLAKADEVTIGEGLASALGIGVGDRLRFASYSPAQAADPGAGSDLTPRGPRVALRVVGIVRRPLDLGARGAAGGVIVPTPAFLARYRDEIGSWSGSILRVRTERGGADTARIASAARRIFGGAKQFAILVLGAEGQGARDAIDVASVGLWIAASVAALAALVAIGLALSREVALVDRDQRTLDAIGMRRRTRAAAAASLGLPVALVGALLSVAAASLVSSVFPVGVARLAEPDPGVHLDGVALGVGCLAIVVTVLSIAGAAASRVARTGVRQPAPERTTRWSRLTSRLAAHPDRAIGVRFAVDRGRGREALPVRSSLFGAVFGVFVIVAVGVFAVGLDRLVTTPARYGWNWDLLTFDEQATDGTEGCALSTRLTSVQGVTAVTSICSSPVEIAGRPVPGWGFRSLEGRVGPTVASGRAPSAPDEVALGADTLAATGHTIGDRVRISGPERSGRFLVVGEAVMPSFTDAAPIADSAVFTVPGLTRLGPLDGDWNIVVRLATGGDRAATLAELRTISGANGPPRNAVVPAEIDRVRQIDRLPVALAAFVVIVALAAIGFALVTTVRRRRHTFAILKSIGFSRRQVRATVAWQATTVAAMGLVIGIPLGMMTGRLVWQAVAEQLGVASDPNWPGFGVLVLVPAALVAVNLVALLPARRAARTRPAVVLRSE
jgi:hypothetical protein